MSKKKLVTADDYRIDRDKWRCRAKNQQHVIDTLRRHNNRHENNVRALENALNFFRDPKTAENAGAYIQTRHIVKAWDELWDYVNSEIHQLKESGYVDEQATLANYKRIRDEMRKIKRVKAEEGVSE